MFRPLSYVLVISILSFSFLPGFTSAQTTPTTINYQGRLTDNTPQQDPIDAIVSMRFSIWDAASGGANLWQEPASGGIDVSVSNGIFSISLGSNVAMPASVFTGANSARYLEVTINPDLGSEEILAPRQLISSIGYAQLAENANTAVNATSAGDADGLGGVAASGWQKAINVTCISSQFVNSISNDGSTTCGTPSVPSETDPQVGTISTNRVPKWNGSALVNSTITVDGSNEVGIGITSPTSTLDVNGDIRVRGGSPAVGKALVALNTGGTAAWDYPVATGSTSSSGTEGFIDAGSGSGWVDITPTITPVQGPGTFLVFVTFRYKVSGGSGTDNLNFRIRANNDTFGSVTSSATGWVEDKRRDLYHIQTFHVAVTLPESAQYTLRLQYSKDGSDDDLYYDDLKLSAIQIQ